MKAGMEEKKPYDEDAWDQASKEVEEIESLQIREHVAALTTTYDAIVERNVQAVTNTLSLYDKQLVALWNNYPDDWNERAQDEFGFSQPQIEKDWREIQTRLADEIQKLGLTRMVHQLSLIIQQRSS